MASSNSILSSQVGVYIKYFFKYNVEDMNYDLYKKFINIIIAKFNNSRNEVLLCSLYYLIYFSSTTKTIDIIEKIIKKNNQDKMLPDKSTDPDFSFYNALYHHKPEISSNGSNKRVDRLLGLIHDINYDPIFENNNTSCLNIILNWENNMLIQRNEFNENKYKKKDTILDTDHRYKSIFLNLKEKNIKKVLINIMDTYKNNVNVDLQTHMEFVDIIRVLIIIQPEITIKSYIEYIINISKQNCDNNNSIYKFVNLLWLIIRHVNNDFRDDPLHLKNLELFHGLFKNEIKKMTLDKLKNIIFKELDNLKNINKNIIIEFNKKFCNSSSDEIIKHKMPKCKNFNSLLYNKKLNNKNGIIF